MANTRLERPACQRATTIEDEFLHKSNAVLRGPGAQTRILAVADALGTVLIE
jgi:hypothetical protein